MLIIRMSFWKIKKMELCFSGNLVIRKIQDRPSFINAICNRCLYNWSVTKFNKEKYDVRKLGL